MTALAAAQLRTIAGGQRDALAEAEALAGAAHEGDVPVALLQPHDDLDRRGRHGRAGPGRE